MARIYKLDTDKKKSKSVKEDNKEHGSVAWDRLISKSQPRLKKADRVIIAENLYDVITRKGLNALNLAEKIWTHPEEQYRGNYRYLLPTNLSPEKRATRIGNLAADKHNYRRIIEEILKATPEEDRNLLVDRITYGTSLHPAAGENLSEAELLFSALQAHIIQLNEKHDLFSRYRSIQEEYQDLVNIQGEFPNYGCLPQLDEHGELHADNWYEIIPYLPHVCLGIADQFNWICAYEDSLYWPLPSTIEYGSKSLGNRERRAQLMEEVDWESEMEKWGANSISELSQKKMEHYRHLEEQAKRQPKDPEWVHWHQVFIDTLQQFHPKSLSIVWEETENDAEPRFEDGSSLSSINLVLHKARKAYLTKLAAELIKRGMTIPDEVFSGSLWDADEHRPMMEIVKLTSELTQKPFPSQAKRLYELDEENKQVFDDYGNALPSPVWLTVCFSHEGTVLVPTLVFRRMEWSPGCDEGIYGYAIDSPRALLELHRYSEISIAWPSQEPCIKRLRELVSNETIEQDWQKTAESLKYHPLSKRYEHEKKLHELLDKQSQASTQQKNDEN